MYQVKFGTDGWRAIIGEDYTVENVVRLTEAVAKWLKRNNETPKCNYWLRLPFQRTTIYRASS